MSVKTALKLSLCLGPFFLSGCFSPPYNNFTPEHRTLKRTAITTTAGATAGALIGSAVGSTGVGAVLGGAAGVAVGLYSGNQHNLIKKIKKQHMQYFAYGDTMTLVVPTDRYFLYDSPHLNDLCYEGLNNIVRLLKFYPNCPIYVAAFTDDVGTRHHKNKLSQAQAEAMITFLWANDIPARLLHAEGYGSQHDVADNRWVHGSAFNRRLEIQWQNGACPTKTQPIYTMK